MTQVQLTGQLTVPLPPNEAFRLFTARGEQDWVSGWEPQFPEPTPDDSAPGTVFQTNGHGHTTTWLVTERIASQRIAYARLTPEISAGSVAVTLADAEDGCDVTVAYHLTALGPHGETQLREFAQGYDSFLQSWRDAIIESLQLSSTDGSFRHPQR